MAAAPDVDHHRALIAVALAVSESLREREMRRLACLRDSGLAAARAPAPAPPQRGPRRAAQRSSSNAPDDTLGAGAVEPLS